MKIVISPYSQKLRGKTEINPKNYPVRYFKELITLLKQTNIPQIVQIGITGEEPLVEDFRPSLPFSKLKELIINEMDLFFSVDNFFPHICHHYGKHGVVLWGLGNPEIFGYSENLNLYRDKKYFRPDQFGIWESILRNEEAFVKPDKVIEAIQTINL